MAWLWSLLGAIHHHSVLGMSVPFLGTSFPMPSFVWLPKGCSAPVSTSFHRLVSVYKFQHRSQIHPIVRWGAEITPFSGSQAMANLIMLFQLWSSSLLQGGSDPLDLCGPPSLYSQSLSRWPQDCAAEQEILLALPFQGQHGSDVQETHPHRWPPGCGQ